MACSFRPDDAMKRTHLGMGGGIIAAGFIIGLVSADPVSREALSARAGGDAGSVQRMSAGTTGPHDLQSGLAGIALGALIGEPDLSGLARLGEVLPLLAPEQLGELLDRLEKEPSESPSPRTAWLFSWLLLHHERVATDWIMPRLEALAQDGPRSAYSETSGLGKMIMAWAQAAPQEALEFARNRPGSTLSEQLLTAAILAWPAPDNSNRLAVLLNFPAGRARTGALASLFTGWTESDPQTALASAATLEPEVDRKTSSAAIVRAWAKTDAGAALEAYRSGGLDDVRVLSEVLESLAATDPSTAVAALEALPQGDFARCSPRVAIQWAKHDPSAALSWAMQHGLGIGPQVEEETRVEHQALRRMTSITERFLGSPLKSALDSQPDATLAWMQSLPPGAVRDQAYELAVAATGDLDLALKLFSTLGPEASARAAYGMSKRFADKPELARDWIEGLPSGPVRFQAMAGLGASVRTAEPSNIEDRDAWLSGLIEMAPTAFAALKQVIKISDPKLRKDVFDEIFKSVHGTPEARNRVIDYWMEEAGLSEEWKRRLTD